MQNNIKQNIPRGRSFLRWAGSKRKLLPILLEYIPTNFNRYIEPFAGSSCLFFAIRPSQGVLGDINEELIHTYSMVKKHPRLVARLASKLENTQEQYLEIRRQSPDDLTLIDRAVRFIYLNRYCFNGVYRTNMKGQFNVPRGTRTGEMPPESFFFSCSVALRSIKLIAGDFETCINDVRKGDFVYLDPPYATSSRNTTGEYGPNSFKKSDISRLLKSIHKIDNTGAFFLLSYCYNLELLEELSNNWMVTHIEVPRHVAGFSKHRGKAKEILVTNIPRNRNSNFNKNGSEKN